MRALAVSLFALVLAGTAVAAEGDPRKALTRESQAIARSAVLKRSDLPPAFVSRKRGDADIPSGARCDALSESDLTVRGDAASTDFALVQPNAYVSVGSSARVYRTLEEANTSWRRGTSAAATTCFGDLVRLTAPSAQAIEIVSAKRVPFARVAPKTTAYRVVATLSVPGGRKVRAYFDAILLQRGTIQVGLVVTSLGAPVEAAAERGLAELLAARMAKAKRPNGPVA